MKGFGRILIIAAMLFSFSSVHAELEPQWPKGTMIGNVNAGFFGVDYGVSVSFDYVLFDELWAGQFTAGVETCVSVDKKDTNNKFGRASRNVGIMPRATYGINVSRQFEVHATAGLGLGIGEEVFLAREVRGDNFEPFININLLMGCRMFLTDNFAIMTEVGYSYRFPQVRLGFSIKR